jgi:drug/metabolite transporter (DMT)-like permease
MIAGFLYAFGATLSWAIAAFPLTKAARQLPANNMNHLRLLLAAVVLFLAALLIEGKSFTTIFSKQYEQGWLWLGVSGVIALVIGDLLSFRSYAILGPQHGSVLTTLSPAAALLAGIILVDEHINFIGIIGMCITIIGVMSISLGRKQRDTIPDHGQGSVLSGILLGVLAACCHGSALAFSKKGFLEQAAAGYPAGPLAATFIRIITATVLLYLLSMLTNRFPKVYKDLKGNKKMVATIVTGSLFNPVLSVSLSMIAILYMNVAVAQTIFSMVPLFALLIAFFVYKERISPRSVIGIIAALAGVCLLIWRNKITGLF